MDLLPIDIIFHVLSYNRNFVIRKGKLHTIRRLDMNQYNLVIAPKKYVTKSYLITHDCLYGSFVQFKNKNHRLYYREDATDIEIVFETIYYYEGNLIVLWQSQFIE